MHQLISLQELRQKQRMKGVQIRLPPEIVEKAKRLAAQQSSDGRKFTETDVYRTAIMDFLDQISTKVVEP